MKGRWEPEVRAGGQGGSGEPGVRAGGQGGSGESRVRVGGPRRRWGAQGLS